MAAALPHSLQVLDRIQTPDPVRSPLPPILPPPTQLRTPDLSCAAAPTGRP